MRTPRWTYTGEQGDDAGVTEARDRSGAALDEALRTARNGALQARRARRPAGLRHGVAAGADTNGLASYADNVVKMLRQHTGALSKAGLTFDPTPRSPTASRPCSTNGTPSPTPTSA